MKEKRKWICSLVIGFIFILLGIGIILSSLSTKRKLLQYKEEGIAISAQIIDIVVPPKEYDENYEEKLEQYKQDIAMYHDDGIVSKNQSRAIIFQYEWENKIYIKSLGFFSEEDKYDLGNEITIYILSDDPNDFKVDFSGTTSANIFFVFGIITLVVSFFEILFSIIKLIYLHQWFSSSKKVHTKIVFFELKKEERGKYYFTVVCSYFNRETSEEQFFNSQMVHSKNHPSTFLEHEVETYLHDEKTTCYIILPQK